MLKKTKGIIGGYEFIVEELKDIFPILQSQQYNFAVGNENTAKFVCMIQMIMAFKWTDDELPAYLRDFNGLYIKYLEFSHVIALFQINGKLGVLSHSGIPQKTTNKDFLDDKKLTYPFGYDWDNDRMNFKPNQLRNVIEGIEREKEKLIAAVQNKKNNLYQSNIDTIIDKFVHLTAATSFDNVYDATSKNSPVVWGMPIQTQERLDISVQIGGSGYTNWIEQDFKVAEDQKIYAENGEQIISYNIFGHTPQHFNPSVYRENHTLHVNLDVSKIEANFGNKNSANNFSFAFFYINGTNGNNDYESLLGRIQFPKLPQLPDNQILFPYKQDTLTQIVKGLNQEFSKAEVVSKTHDGCAYMDENAITFIRNNPIYYYNKRIPVVGEYSLLKDHVIDTPLKCINFPPNDFTKYISYDTSNEPSNETSNPKKRRTHPSPPSPRSPPPSD